MDTSGSRLTACYAPAGMSISEKQLAANRANAARSTGPLTPEGKARSARNARKHGFRAADFAVVRLEDLEAVDRLRADLIALYGPVNSQELFAIERMALAQLAILRAARLEAGLLTLSLNEALEPSGEGKPFIPMSEELAGDLEVTRAQNRNFALCPGPACSPPSIRRLAAVPALPGPGRAPVPPRPRRTRAPQVPRPFFTERTHFLWGGPPGPRGSSRTRKMPQIPTASVENHHFPS